MGNANGGGGGSFRQETVNSASYHTRTLQGNSGSSSSSGNSGNSGASHHGVVVHTDQGNSYLIHHPGASGRTTVTRASNMSNNWTKSHDIPVSGQKTVQEVFNGAGGRTNNPLVNYITAGTCVGAAKGAEAALKEPQKPK